MEGYVLPPTFSYNMHKRCHRTHSSTCNQSRPIYEEYADDSGTSRPIGGIPEELYVEKVLNFLSDFSWIYDFQITHLLTGPTLNLIPAEWSHFLTSLTSVDLNELPSNPNMVGIPTSLSDFIRTCQELSLPREVHDDITPVNLPQSVTKGMNPKKRHEVSKMTAVVTDLSIKSNCPLVVDVGAGLGYLSAVIARNSKLHVLALECREMLTHGTEARGLDQGLAENLDALTYNLQDNEDNFLKLRTILLEKLQSCRDSMPSSVPDGEFEKQGRVPSQLPYCSDNNLGISQTDGRSCRTQNLGLALVNSKTEGEIGNASQAEHDSNSCVKNMHSSRENSSTAACQYSHVTPGTSETCTASSTGSDAGLRTPEVSRESSPDLTGSCQVGEAGVCMVGLHCCGSLTPTMLRLFTSTPEVHSLLCVSCCYHSLQHTGTNTWAHFPMSQVVKDTMESKLPTFNISVFGMRLAAQETRARWATQSEADHIFHRNNVGFRALLQLVCQQEGLTIEKEKKHLANKKDMASLDTYISAVLQRSNLGKECPELGNKLYASYEEHMGKFDLIEPFTGLQVALQPVLESLVLIDRILYLREAGTDATLVPIFHDAISPRNMAIVAVK